VVVLFGLGAALVYGAADFAGGLAARRTPALAVVVLSQIAALVVLAAVLPLLGTPVPPVRDLGTGAVAGIAGGAGVTFLYRGLAAGRMGVVAPVTAVGAACLPVFVGLLLGERPGPLALVGVAVALVAVVAVSAEPSGGTAGRRGLGDAVIAGAGFGIFFILLARVGEAAGLWPLLTARTSILVVGAAALVTRTPLRAPPGQLLTIALAGVGDMAANVLYLFAAQTGLLSLAAVLTSLYPAATVLLARILLGERLARLQIAGVLLAITGAALIATG
jgi:drug/metabolite transporter (DMT)-like permease